MFILKYKVIRNQSKGFNSFLLVTTPLYCAYFTVNLYGNKIHLEKELSVYH